jgi:recombination protein RecR
LSQINSSLPSIDRLVEAFQRLPGIGPKSAQRLTYHLIKMKREESEELASAALGVKDNLTTCEICFNISEKSQCSICSDDKRNNHIICVVEEPLNVLAIESARIFKGLYHVLYGVISPVNAIGPDNLKISELTERIKNNEIKEIIIATNPTLQGDATASYIRDMIMELDKSIEISRLARGLPSGSDIEYVDDSTLVHALNSRSSLK